MAETPSLPAASAETLLLLQEIATATQRVLLGEVARLIAHEISQPLAAVAANGGACLRWLERDPPDLEEARAAARRLIADAHRAAQEMRGIAAFVQRQPLARDRQPVGPVIDTAVALAAPLAAQRQVAVSVDCARDLPDVEINRAQLLHVVFSLLTNACEALERVPLPRTIRVEAAHRAGELEVSIADNGPGVGEAGPHRPFEAFYTTKADGLGLGLAVSHAIVESHGGRLWVGPLGGGHAFRFTLPAAPR